MSKKRRVVFGVGYKVEEQSAKSLEKVAKDIQTKLGKAIGDSANKELQTIIDDYKNIKNVIDGFDGEKISPKAFDQVNDALNKTTKEFDNFLKKITSKIALDIDVDALEELDDEINELEKSLSDLDDKMKLGSKLSTESGERDFTKTLMDSKMEEKFPGFTGRTDSLEIEGLHKNRVEYEAVSKAYDQLIAKQSKLENSTKTLTKAQKEELELIQSPVNQEKIKMLKEVLDFVDAEIKAEKRKQEQYTKDHANFVEEYNEKIEKRQELISLSETDAGKILSDASGAVSGAKTDLRRSKFKKDIDTEEYKDQQRYLESLKGLGTGTEKAVDNVLERYFSITAGLRLLNSMAKKTIDIISDLDAAFVSISVVTQYTNKQVWGMYDSFSNIASAAGFTVGEIGKVASEYFRQGESYTNVLTLTEAAAKSAQVAGIDAADSVRYLTSAVKGYSLAASEAMAVSDKFAALAASTATNYEGLATAMSKVAAQASANSVEMDNLMGMMATAMEVTQEAPENIGTAFKTILARMSEIKDYGKVLEDGVDANRIEKALKIVGVQLFDNNHEMRALDEVLLEVGASWGTLNRSQKAYIATSLAGTRQQTRLLAVLENMEMTEKNIQTSRDSAGATEAQQLKNTESLAYNFNRINVAFERFTKNMAKNTWILAAVKGFASTIEVVVGLTDTWVGQIAVATLAVGAFGKALHYAITLPKFVEMVSGAFDTVKAMKELGKAGEVAAGTFSLLGKAGTAVGNSFMFLLPYVTVAAVAALGAVAVFKTWKYFLPEKQIERTAETINKLNGELYNIKQSKQSTEELVNEFIKLEKQVIKTSESIERQAEILQLLEDADVDGDYKFRDAAGGLNLEQVDKYQKDLLDKEQELFEEKMDNGLKLVDRYDKLTKQVDQLNAAEALAIKELANGSLEEWEKVDDAIKIMAANWAKANLESGEQAFFKADGSHYTGDVKTVAGSERIETEYGTATRATASYVGEDGEELTAGISESALQRLHEYKETLDTSKVSMAEYNEELRKIAPEHLLMTDAMFVSSEAFSNSNDISIDGMERLGEVMEMIKGHNIDLSEEQQKALIESYDPSRPQVFFSELQQLYANAEGATASFAHAVVQMQEILENMSFEQLVDGLTTFESLEVQIDKVNDSMDQFNAESLKGAMDLMEQYREYPELIGDMAEQLIEFGHINDETQEAMLNAEKQKQLESIQMKIDENEAAIQIKQAEADMYLRAAEAEGELAEIASAHQIDVSSMSASEIAQHLQTLGGEYEDLFSGILDAASEVGNKLPAALSGEVQSLTTNVKTGKGDYTSNANQVASMVDKLKGAAALAAEEVAQLSAQNLFLDAAMKKINSGTWNKSMKEIEKAAKGAENATKGAGDAAKGAAEAVDYYTGKLNKLYVAQKRLEVVNWGKGLLEAKKSYIEAANAVEGLAGAQRSLTKESVAQVNEDAFFAYELEKKELQNLIKVSGEYKNKLEKDLNPALRNSYQIINGRVIPVTSKYKKLTAEQMETVDNFAESFNGLTTEVESYTEGMWAAEAAQNAIINSMQDRVIEFENTMIAAIKNQEKKQIESFKTIIDANKKYIAERKKLYEKGFEDEDNEKQEQDIVEQRQALVEKLATLEAAHDLTSVQKKEAYKKELAELDDQFNNLMLERNREALLQSLDNQIEYQDDVYTKEEEAYNARIESGEWLEARLKEITDQARLQAIIDTISHDITIQRMLELGYINQETATRLGEEAISKTISELSEEQYGILKDYWGKNWDVVNEMWNGVGDKYGAEELSQKAMDNILKFLEEHSTDMEGTTSNMKKKVLNEWESLLTDVMAYTNNLNSLEIKSPDYSHLSKGLSNMLSQIRVTADAAELEYKRIMDSNRKSDEARASERAKQQAHNRQLQDLKNEAPTVSTSGRIANQHGVFASSADYQKWLKNNQKGNNPNMYAPMATGGTTERTGLHWLDGKPGAPERVLSPGANKQFEALLGSLIVESRQNATKGSVGDNSEVVNTLMSVIKAVYDSGQESAKTIVEAIGDLERGDQGASIRSIATKHGISINRRGDK